MQGLGYLYEFGDKSAIVPYKPKKTLDLIDSSGGGPFSNNIYFAFVFHYFLGRDNMP